ncbi:hypothetical protein PYCC9005_000317 [Savitreella phatthalungensis]
MDSSFATNATQHADAILAASTQHTRRRSSGASAEAERGATLPLVNGHRQSRTSHTDDPTSAYQRQLFEHTHQQYYRAKERLARTTMRRSRGRDGRMDNTDTGVDDNDTATLSTAAGPTPSMAGTQDGSRDTTASS